MTDQPTTPRGSGSERRPRTKKILVRMSDDEYNDASERANRAGLALGAFARLAMLGNPGLGFQRRPQVEKELLLRTLGQLAHLNHLAQTIARNITTSGSCNVSEIHQIEKDYRPLRDAILAALKERSPEKL
jgi:hypothetical protein